MRQTALVIILTMIVFTVVAAVIVTSVVLVSKKRKRNKAGSASQNAAEKAKKLVHKLFPVKWEGEGNATAKATQKGKEGGGSGEAVKHAKAMHMYVHVCMIGEWRKILQKLLARCHQSGLLNEVAACHVVAVGDVKEHDNLRKIVQRFEKCEIRRLYRNIKLYERPTLSLMWEDCQKFEPDTRILYLHTKGVTHKEGRKKRCIQDWIDFMSAFVIDRFPMATQLLERFDACGVNFLFQPSMHFSGNFWWSKSSHVRTLRKKIGKDYLDPEMWICSREDGSYASMAQSNVHHYAKRYEPKKYETKPVQILTNRIQT